MCNHDLAPPTDAPVIELTLRVDRLDQLAKLRRLVTYVATFVGLPPEQAEDLVLATHEIAANAIVHGLPPALVGLHADETGVTCEVTDRGQGFAASRARDAVSIWAESGRGLRMAKALQKGLTAHRRAGGFTVTMRAANA